MHIYYVAVVASAVAVLSVALVVALDAVSPHRALGTAVAEDHEGDHEDADALLPELADTHAFARLAALANHHSSCLCPSAMLPVQFRDK